MKLYGGHRVVDWLASGLFFVNFDNFLKANL